VKRHKEEEELKKKKNEEKEKIVEVEIKEKEGEDARKKAVGEMMQPKEEILEKVKKAEVYVCIS